jgi:serine/threonine-protein kinase
MKAAKRWAAVKALFDAAVAMPVEERTAWLSGRCGHDTALRAEVESLLASHERPHRVFDATVAGIEEGDEPTLPPGCRIGAYQIEQLVGCGGMGVVYRATRSDEAFEKQVAIKIVPRGNDTAEILRRFRSERQVLASLDHPNITALLDGGTTPEGLPYFVMEYVAGEPIDAYCGRRALPLDDRLRLFLRVCAALQYAHQHLVVHRDLKPDNILVRDDGEPKLLDFGIAKLLEPSGLATHTTVALRALTPRYASPEQIRGEPISTSTDIYSLGVLLYQLLTDRLPYVVEDKSSLDIERVICEEQPLRPSDAARNDVRAGAWWHQLTGDLDAIALMALRKEPDRRYRSVEQFADDIGRYLQGLPIVAGPDTLGYRAAKFVRRNRLATAAAAVAALALIVGIVATMWSARIARGEAAAASAARERAEAEATRVQRMNTFLTNVLALPDPNWYSPGAGGRADMTVADLLAQVGERIDRELGSYPDIAAEFHHTIGNTYRARGLYKDAQRHFAAALALRRSLFGDQHPKVAESLYFLGASEMWLGSAKKAEELWRQAIAIERRLSVPDANLPQMLRDLGGILDARGDLDGAERAAAEALKLFEERYGADDIRVAFAEQALGQVRFDRGDLASARHLLERARRILTSSPQGFAGIADILFTLGDVTLAEGDATGAEDLFRQAIEQSSAALGSDHPIVANQLMGLAAALNAQRRYRDAEDALRRSIAISRARMPPTDSQVVRGLTLLSATLRGAGRPREGERYLREAVALVEKAPEPNQCVAGQLTVTLGVTLREDGRREADALLKQGLQDTAAGCGRDSRVYRNTSQAVAQASLVRSGIGNSVAKGGKSQADR